MSIPTGPMASGFEDRDDELNPDIFDLLATYDPDGYSSLQPWCDELTIGYASD
jgi:hypothetical protein